MSKLLSFSSSNFCGLLLGWVGWKLKLEAGADVVMTYVFELRNMSLKLKLNSYTPKSNYLWQKCIYVVRIWICCSMILRCFSKSQIVMMIKTSSGRPDNQTYIYRSLILKMINEPKFIQILDFDHEKWCELSWYLLQNNI